MNDINLTLDIEKNEGVVTIDMAQYKMLIEDSIKLCCLEAGGVDNWSGYDDSMNDYESRLENWKTR